MIAVFWDDLNLLMEGVFIPGMIKLKKSFTLSGQECELTKIIQ